MKVPFETAEAELQDARILWINRNRGALTEISKSLGLSKSMVRRVYIGELVSKGRRVEQELARRGAPGFTETA